MKNPKPIIIVSGLPRSGTSLMMQMLHAAGVPLLSDDFRPADANNPRGYFEAEAVKNLEHENEWLLNARGKALKVISHLLKFLPADQDYKIIFMNRDLSAVIQSQNRMLHQLGKDSGNLSDSRLYNIYQHHVQSIKQWLHKQQNMQTLEISYEELISHPKKTIKPILVYLQQDVDQEAMISVIDKRLDHSSK